MDMRRDDSPEVETGAEGASVADDHHASSRTGNTHIDPAFLPAETDAALGVGPYQRNEDEVPLSALVAIAGLDGQAEILDFCRELSL
jgi:hypothetical protein